MYRHFRIASFVLALLACSLVPARAAGPQQPPPARPQVAPPSPPQVALPVMPIQGVAPGQGQPPPARPTTTPPAPTQAPGQGQQQGRGQTPQPAAQGTPVPPARVVTVPTQNVRLEVTITDSFGSGVAGGVSGGVAGGVSGGVASGAGPAKKTVTMLIADGHSGSIRSANDVQTPTGFRTININVDSQPTVRDGGRIQLSLSVQYVPELSTLNSQAPSAKPANINESLTVMLNDGKSTLITQSADPSTDRKVTVEVTATIVK
jgi:hypothetical protein